MVEQQVIEAYLDESTFNMTQSSRYNLKQILLKFLNLQPCIPFDKLRQEDFLEKYSHLLLISMNSFYTHKSKINDFARWMYENEMCSQQVLSDLSKVKYEDIDRSEFYKTFYFRDITDLYSTMEDVFSDRGSEFDTFRTAALLVWFGIQVNDLPLILKTDLDEEFRTILHPITKQKISLECEIESVFYFILRYKNADSCDTRKFGGRTLPYPQTHFLLRSYKNAQFTAAQLNNLSATANRIAEDFGKIFQWKRIYLSGLYYRIYQYEESYGDIYNDFDMLKFFFDCKGEITSQLKQVVTRKYREYLEFRSYMY